MVVFSQATLRVDTVVAQCAQPELEAPEVTERLHTEPELLEASR
jgi:hypothetical protein